MKEFFGEDYLCTGISLMKKTEKHGIQIRKNYEKSCYLSRRNTTLENGIEYGNAEEYLKSLV